MPNSALATMADFFGSFFGRIENNKNDFWNYLTFKLTYDSSGGQQRRVSFAVALLHNPELLILDEPTVGVDPMLRQSIWNHLIRLSTEQKKTILITTHYIEEARQANTVSVKRFLVGMSVLHL